MIKDFFMGAVWRNTDIEAYLAKDATVFFVPEHIFDEHRNIFTALIYSGDNV